jgi:hypothetical protein
MRFFVEIETDNAAFEDSPGSEIARILRGIASRVQDVRGEVADEEFRVMDVNGNKVGTWGFADA